MSNENLQEWTLSVKHKRSFVRTRHNRHALDRSSAKPQRKRSLSGPLRVSDHGPAVCIVPQYRYFSCSRTVCPGIVKSILLALHSRVSRSSAIATCCFCQRGNLRERHSVRLNEVCAHACLYFPRSSSKCTVFYLCGRDLKIKTVRNILL